MHKFHDIARVRSYSWSTSYIIRARYLKEQGDSQIRAEALQHPPRCSNAWKPQNPRRYRAVAFPLLLASASLGVGLTCRQKDNFDRSPTICVCQGLALGRKVYVWETYAWRVCDAYRSRVCRMARLCFPPETQGVFHRKLAFRLHGPSLGPTGR